MRKFLPVSVVMFAGFTFLGSIVPLLRPEPVRELTTLELASFVGGTCDMCRKTATDPQSSKNCQQCRVKPYGASEKYNKGPFGKDCVLESPDTTSGCNDTGGEIVCGTGVPPESPLGEMLYFISNEDCLGEAQGHTSMRHTVATASGAVPCPS